MSRIVSPPPPVRDLVRFFRPDKPNCCRLNYPPHSKISPTWSRRIWESGVGTVTETFLFRRRRSNVPRIAQIGRKRKKRTASSLSSPIFSLSASLPRVSLPWGEGKGKPYYEKTHTGNSLLPLPPSLPPSLPPQSSLGVGNRCDPEITPLFFTPSSVFLSVTRIAISPHIISSLFVRIFRPMINFHFPLLFSLQPSATTG